ncbi:helix-turn-helix domain-containing protein [Paenibacillus arenilitoris]|uniref:Helix-turn-helix domain-containing protein n=1 Tax=Paenibacillus arenilitoris TaxID=2772299 RepID=A0A927CL14_9BACL|nr:helix-turn-helix domain-containing protein [Paenibacillus arenilitoris]MBD2868747.1 helix-turn-helix domain-containing protein [Paenibacillus arenilitoris]
MKLLIADDQASLHTFLAKMMDWRSLGITEVIHAYDGKETLLRIGEMMPDLLILDIQMPFKSGLDLLKELDRPLGKPRTVILSAHDEFEFAREAMHLNVTRYLLKPVDVALLTRTLRELIASIREEGQALLASELGNAVRSLSASEDAAAAVGRSFRSLRIRQYAVLSAEGELPPVQSFGRELGGLDASLVAAVHPVSSRKYAILLGTTAEMTDERLLELCRLLAERWSAAMPGADASIGLSAAAREPERLPELCRQSEEASLQRFYSGEAVNLYEPHYFAADLRSMELHKYERAIAEKLAYGLQAESVTGVEAELFEHLRRQRLHPEKAYALVLRCIYAAGQALNGIKGDAADWEGITLGDLKGRKTADALERFLQELLSGFADPPREARLAGDTVRRIQRFVDRHYDQDLSLRRIAALFAIDKFQLSRLFKQELAINYWAYVMQVRVGKAAEMLVRTDMKNSAIAEATGFVDESHFSRTFKKLLDQSPRQYRQANKR